MMHVHRNGSLTEVACGTSALEEAIKLQTAIVDLAPHSWEMQASLANLYYYAGENAPAEAYAQKAVKLNPLSASSQKLLGRIMVQVGRGEEGLPHLQLALALAPQDGECWYKTGSVYFEQGHLERAALCFRTAGALRNDSLSYLSAAHTLHKLKQRGAAYKLYHASVRADPKNQDAWTDFAFALSDGQYHEWAEWASRKALAIRPSGDNYFGVGNHLLSQRRYAAARELYMQGAALSPMNPGLMHNLAFSCHLSGDALCAGVLPIDVHMCSDSSYCICALLHVCSDSIFHLLHLKTKMELFMCSAVEASLRTSEIFLAAATLPAPPRAATATESAAPVLFSALRYLGLPEDASAILLGAGEKKRAASSPLVLTPEEQGRAPMYVAGLGHALRRAGQLDLCVGVMAALATPPASALLSYGKSIINAYTSSLRPHTLVA